MNPAATAGLFVLTAILEMVGCFLPYLSPRDRAGAWVLLPAALALTAFVSLLYAVAAVGNIAFWLLVAARVARVARGARRRIGRP